MERIICLIIGYAFGLFQTGYFVGKLNHVDIRKTGSGNSGSTNALRVLGVKAGLMTFVGDVLKCVLPILLVRQIFSGSDCLPLLAMYTGAGATLGHNYPFYLKFKGGKGIAVLAGLVLSTKLWMVPIPLAAFIFVVAVTRYVSAGSLLVTIIFLAEVICFGQLPKQHSIQNFLFPVFFFFQLVQKRNLTSFFLMDRAIQRFNLSRGFHCLHQFFFFYSHLL